MKILTVSIPLPFECPNEIEELIEKYGEERVKETIASMYTYEIIKNVGDVYEESIPLDKMDMDELKGRLGEY